MSNLGHYKNYYEVFNALDPSAPAIPLLCATLALRFLYFIVEIVFNYILAVVLQDLFLLDDVMSDMNEDGWINWKKMASLGRQVSQVCLIILLLIGYGSLSQHPGVPATSSARAARGAGRTRLYPRGRGLVGRRHSL